MCITDNVCEFFLQVLKKKLFQLLDPHILKHENSFYEIHNEIMFN